MARALKRLSARTVATEVKPGRHADGERLYLVVRDPSVWRHLVEGVVEGSRNTAVSRLTGHLLRRYVDAEVAHELVQAWNVARCRPALSPEEVTKIVGSIARKERQRREGRGVIALEHIVGLSEFQQRKSQRASSNAEPLTEDWAARVFAERYADTLLFCYDSDKWPEWTGAAWVPNRVQIAFQWARELAREMRAGEPAKVQAIASKVSFASGVERFARSDPTFAVTILRAGRKRQVRVPERAQRHPWYYATTAAMDTFTATKGDKHPTDLAMLRGARLVTASETEEDRGWAEARIKQLTGSDPITARFIRQDFFTFMPTFKLTIVGNHQPMLRNVDEAARRRFNIVPFTRKPAHPDQQLEEKLRGEWPAILRWMIEGCLDWQQNGLVRAQSVAEATEAYFAEQDFIGQWLAEKCTVRRGDTTLWDRTADLYGSWSAYAKAAGEPPGPVKAFGPAMRRKGLVPYRTMQARGFSGVLLQRERPYGEHVG